MTVNADGAEGMQEARRVVTIPELSAPSYLQTILSITYRDEQNSVPLTVVTGAGMVFGNAVHPSEWLRRLGDQLRELAGSERNDSADAMAQMFDEMAEERTDENPGPDIPMKDIRWIYFTDSLVVPVGNITPSYATPACWQVALRDVTGWTIGLPPG